MAHQLTMEETDRYIQSLGKLLDSVLNGTGEKQTCFVLLLAPFDAPDGARCNYLSNGEREDVVSLLKEIVNRFEGYAGEGGHA